MIYKINEKKKNFKILIGGSEGYIGTKLCEF